jgi:hypothetical protein
MYVSPFRTGFSTWAKGSGVCFPKLRNEAQGKWGKKKKIAHTHMGE